MHEPFIDDDGNCVWGKSYSYGKIARFVNLNGRFSSTFCKEGKKTCVSKSRSNDKPAVITAVSCGNGVHYEWAVNGSYHREHDRPAIIYKNGEMDWWYEGNMFRANGKPSSVNTCGEIGWWYNGESDRNKGHPAVLADDGRVEWWVDGELHRENDLPAVIHPDGTLEWWYRGEKHRDGDLPAVINLQEFEWWYRNEKHRWFNPAVVTQRDAVEWWMFNERHRLVHPKMRSCTKAPAFLSHDGKVEWWHKGKLKTRNEVHACSDDIGFVSPSD
jgi:hypothetical protein